MLTLTAAVILTVLIILERKRAITLDSQTGSCIFMIGSAAALGLAVFDLLSAFITIFSSFFDISMFADKLDFVVHGSRVSAVIRLIIAGVLSVPMLIGAIYILTAMVRRPLTREGFETDVGFEARCAVRHARLAVIGSAVMGISGLTAILLTIPHWDEVFMTVVVLNPVAVMFLVIITIGMAIVPLAAFALLENAALITIVSVGTVIVGVLYVFAAVLGVAAAVRSYRSRRIEKPEAVICGILALLPVWSIIPMIYLMKKDR